MSLLCDSGFEGSIAPLRGALELHPNAAVGLWRDLRIACVNPGWCRFSRDNGGAEWLGSAAVLGVSYLDCIAPALRPFFEELFDGAAKRDRLTPATHLYECGSVHTHRRFVMAVFGLPQGEGLVVMHTLVEERARDADPIVVPADPDRYREGHGSIMQCAHCRRTRRPDRSGWDWVGAWVETPPPNTSHGLCEICLEIYYPDPG